MATLDPAGKPRPSPAPRFLRRFLALGIIGPIVYVIVFTVQGALTPGYSATRDAVSYLLLGPTGWIQITSFILLGMLLVLFAVGVSRSARSAIAFGWRRVGTLFLGLVGVGFMMAAVFRPDPAGTTRHTTHATLHTIAFEICFFSLTLACVLVGLACTRVEGWRAFGYYSIVTGLLVFVPPLANLASLFSAAPQTPISSPSGSVQFAGLFERVLLVVAFAWYIVLAVRLLRRERA